MFNEKEIEIKNLSEIVCCYFFFMKSYLFIIMSHNRRCVVYLGYQYTDSLFVLFMYFVYISFAVSQIKQLLIDCRYQLFFHQKIRLLTSYKTDDSIHCCHKFVYFEFNWFSEYLFGTDQMKWILIWHWPDHCSTSVKHIFSNI